MPLKNPSHFTLPLYPRYRGVGLSGRSRGGSWDWAKVYPPLSFFGQICSVQRPQQITADVHSNFAEGGTVCPRPPEVYKHPCCLLCFFSRKLFLWGQCLSSQGQSVIYPQIVSWKMLLIKNVVMLWPLQTKHQSSPLCESHVSFNSGKASLWGLGRSHVIVISKLLYYITIFNLQICTGTECTKARLITEPLASAVVQLEWIHGGIAHSQNTCEQAFGLRSAW